MRVPVLFVGALLTGGLGFAQLGPGLEPRIGAPGSTTIPGLSGDPNVNPRAPQGTFSATQRQPFVSGRVLVSGGGVPTERVMIQRVCGTSITQEGFTDAKGRFSVQLGATRITPEATLDGPRAGGFGLGAASSRDSNAHECELRAALPGYTSDSIPLDRRGMDSPDVGTIFLHRLPDAQGVTVSATTALAPKEARKFYDKGLDEIRRNLPDDARKDLQHAVDLDSKFAAAWFELGTVYESGDHFAEARQAYEKSVAADSNYLHPCERLYLLDLKESKWQDAAEASDRVLRLNPYSFPSAYYVNAVANLQLHRLDAAEKSAREAARLTGALAQPAANYLLGYILAQKHEYEPSAECLRLFLRDAPAGKDRTAAEKLLTEVSKLAVNQPAGASREQ